MFPTLAAWLHTLDPYLVVLPGGFPIRWYGLSYLVAFLIAFLLIRRVCRVGISTLPPNRAGDFVVALAIGAVVGGRLGYVLFYRRDLITQATDGFPWWGVLDMGQGGMASHGGMIGATAACLLFAHRHRLPKLHALDLMAFGAPLGLLCGRIANFINGELIGRRCDPGFPLAVKFPQEILDRPQLWEDMTRAYGHELPRNWLDLLQSGNEALQRAATQVLPTRHPSQLYAGLSEGVVVFLVLALLWRMPRRAGTIAGAFGIAYGLMRIANEHFRLPDAHLGFQALGLTRGQWLSLPLILLGTGILIYTHLRQRPAMGSWRRGSWTLKA